MVNARFRCRCCDELEFGRSADQTYCGKADCQRARKNAWRRAKYASDPDYRLNQAQSTATWLEKQGGAAAYYRKYRRRRHRQGGASGTSGNPDDSQAPSANSDADQDNSLVIPGLYRLVPLGGANSDAVSVQISVIAADFENSQISTPYGTPRFAAMSGGP